MNFTQNLNITVVDQVTQAAGSSGSTLAPTGTPAMGIWIVAGIFALVVFVLIAAYVLRRRQRLSPLGSGAIFTQQQSRSFASYLPRLKPSRYAWSTMALATVFLVGNLASRPVAAMPYLNLSATNNSVDITIVKGQTGTVTSVAKATVTTATNIATEHTTAIQLDSTASSPNFLSHFTANTSTMAAPASPVANSYGFAVASSEDHLVANGFDASYSQQANVAAPTGHYAGVSATPTAVKVVPADAQPNGTPVEYQTDFYFAFTADGSLPVGEYTAAITITVSDTSAPTYTVGYSSTDPTNQDVTATIATNESAKTPAGWTKLADNQFSKVYAANAVESVNVIDYGDHSVAVPIAIANIDKTAPVVTVNGANPLSHEAKTVYSDLGASAVDDVAGAVAATIASNTLNPDVKGSYVITYQASDAAGNSATATRTVNVVDSTVPVITVSPATQSIVEDGVIANLDAFMLSGVSASDNYDGDITSSLSYSASPTFDNTTPGAYTITYTVSDSASNAASPVTRIINVTDGTAPTGTVGYSTTAPTNQNVVVTITSSEPITTPAGWASTSATTFTKVYATNSSEAVTISDLAGNSSSVNVAVANIDKTPITPAVTYSTTLLTNGNVVATITTNKAINTPAGWTPTSATQFQRTYTANTTENVDLSDPAGNTTQAAINISNIDKTAPTGSASYSTTAPTNGSVVATITSSEPIITPAGWVSTSATTFTKTYTTNAYQAVMITDLAGNTPWADVIISITNIDQVPPILTIGATTTSFGVGDAIVLTTAVTATDAVSGNLTGAVTTACVDGTLTPLPCAQLSNAAGTYTVTYNVSDAAGNTATGTRAYTISPAPSDSWAKSDASLVLGASAADINLVIDSEMLPIVNLTKTSTTPTYTSTATTEYANYDQQKWANGATLVDNKTGNSYDADGTKHTDGTGAYTPKTYFLAYAPLGAVIPEADVLGYWTYLPRFAYEVQRRDAKDAPITTQQRFEVHFEKPTVGKKFPAATCSTGLPGDLTPANHKAYRTGCGLDRTYPSVAQGIVNNATTWATHPAFTLDPDGYPTNNDGDETELNGIWVSKFEAGQDAYCYNGTGLPAQCGATLTTIAPQFKPGKAPQTYKYIGTQFALGLGVQASHNLSAGAATRQMRNDDWAAVSYLSTSKYGIYDADGNPRLAKVYNNGYYNSAAMADSTTNYLLRTGCGPIASGSDSYNTTCTQYYTVTGQQASTTGNVYGVYDTAGGAWEYTLANRNKTSDPLYFAAANFTSYPQYINTYPVPPFGTRPVGSNATEAYYSYDICTFETCGGQGLHETTGVQSVSSYYQSWGSDYSSFVDSSLPWFIRGGAAAYGSDAGAFASLRSTGYANYGLGWRVTQSN